ncbi:hypothetical protein ABGB14_37080 [Nonomuraea sp. B10E15]|uniref:hypothetical protein n=1 Tax=Nonomuraea sp. B10E15 TaxID=3153560 RepID=UPI00325CFFFE
MTTSPRWTAGSSATSRSAALLGTITTAESGQFGTTDRLDAGRLAGAQVEKTVSPSMTALV